MLVPLQARNLFKKVLLLSHAKLIYARITLTKHTSLYFLFTLVSCIILSALQGVILNDNSRAVRILDDVVASAELSPHLTRIIQRSDDRKVLEVCDGVPGQRDVVCRPVIDMTEGSPALQRRKREIYSRIARRQVLPFPIPPTDEPAEGGEDEAGSVDSGLEDGDSQSSVSDDDGSSVDDESPDPSGSRGPFPSITDTIGPILQSTLRPFPTPSISDLPTVTRLATTTVTSTGISFTVVYTSTYTVSPSAVTEGPPTTTLAVPTGITTTTTLSNPATPPAAPPAPAPSPPSRAETQQQGSVFLEDTCAYALSWLGDGIHDSQVEDVVILIAQFWMMTIGVVAILNESIPHLGAAFFAHLLAGAWSASRIQSTRSLTQLYRTVIVPRACNGEDVLKGWWDERMSHSIPVGVLSAISIMGLGFFSWKLFRVYTNETFSRVGPSPTVHRLYKLLLFFSVGLQLSSFFASASAAMWIRKMSTMRAFASHWKLYIAVFTIFFVLVVPWVIMGWRSVRKESKKQIAAFFALSLLLVGITSVMFASVLYRAIFMRWTFFAAVTVTSFTLLVSTIVLGILCAVNFGKGLSDFLDVREALEGADFTPVSFPTQSTGKRGFDSEGAPEPPRLRPVWATWDTEKAAGDDNAYLHEFHNGNGYPRIMINDSYEPISLSQPAAAYHARQLSSTSGENPFLTAQEVRMNKGASIYSNHARSPIKLSSSPPIVADLGLNAESRWSEFTEDPGFGNGHEKTASVETMQTVRSSGLMGKFNVFGRSTPTLQTTPFQQQSKKHASVISQYEHPTLYVMNPDERRASAVSSVYSRAPPTELLPPVPIPTIIRNPFEGDEERPTKRSSGSSIASVGSGKTVRGMVSAFPTVPQRNMKV